MIRTNANEKRFNILLYLLILFINKIFLLFRTTNKMTELDIAYSFNPNNHNNYQNFNTTSSNNTNNDDNEDNDDNDSNYEPKIEKKERNERKDRNDELLIQQQLQQQQMQQQQQLLMQPMNNYEEKQYKTPVIRKSQKNPEYSFWDRMLLTKNDVIKLVVLSLVIVLGISIEKILFYYINQYLTENLLSPMQDFLVRLTIPVSVILFLWIIKSL